MKRRVTIGGGLILAVGILAGWLSGLFTGFGRGGTGDGTQANVGAANSTVSNTNPKQTKNEKKPAETVERPTDVVEVLIDDREYLVQQIIDGKSEYRSIDLARLVELAKNASGNDDGIRVRITRKTTSRVLAEKQLGEALAEAGLSKEAITWEEGTID